MALQIISTPDFLEPAYQNSMLFVATSNFATFSNFRYIFDVYTIDESLTTSQFRSTVAPFPRPDGSGIYSPHYVLRDVVSYKLQPFITNPTGETYSIANYYLTLGEEYNPGLTFADTRWEAGQLGLTFSTAHNLLTNDIILINKTDKSLNPQYDGTASVISVPNIYEIITDKLFDLSSTNEGGAITDLKRMSYTSSVNRVFRGCRQYDETSINFSDEFLLTNTNDKWLTYFEGVKGLYHTDYQTLSYLKGTASVVPTHAIFRFYNNDYTSIVATYGVTVSATNNSIDVPTAAANIQTSHPALYTLMTNAMSGTYNNTYEVQMGTWSSYPSGSPTYMSQSFTYSYNKSTQMANNCLPNTNREYPVIQIAFLNKLGKFEYLTFNLVSKTSTKVNRKTYKKVLGYNYSIGDRGDTVFDAMINESISMTSDWLTDEEALQVRTLVESPEVYIINQIEYGVGNSIVSVNNNIYPLVNINDSYTIENTLNDTLFNFTLTADKAYNIYTNI